MSFSNGTKELIEAVRRDKYMLPEEKSWDDTLLRVAKALSTNETHEARLLGFLKSGIIVPAGRILAGAGTSRNVTLINCFVMNTLKDSLMGDEGIMDTLSRSAKTMQMGGGIGVDFSPIRPRGARVNGVDAPASGVIPFMDMWNSMCSTIMSAGSRRGAMMATLRCDHPDLWNPDPKVDTFLSAKRQPGRLTNFNISVLVTDAFMNAVKNDLPWDLVSTVAPHYSAGITRPDGLYIYRTVPACELWNQILQSTYKYAEPGIIFIDRVNSKNPLKDIETISSTNPCGEQPLPPNGDCNLSAINLAKCVISPFTPDAFFSYSLFAEAIACAVEMLDNVIDATKFPLHEQEHEAKMKRRIGLGFTGLANAMMMLGIRYGSEASIKFTKKVCHALRLSAYLHSVQLAKTRGTFPAFNHARTSILENLQFTEIQYPVENFGLRNGVLLTIAPTGTTSIAQGDNCSSGIEPVFALEYKRKVLQQDGSFAEHTVRDYGYQQWLDNNPTSPRPDWLVTTADLTPAEHIAVQAAAQEFIDSSISKTVNCPAEMTFEDFSKVYDLAYESGCKGCTTYRPDPDSGRGSVLSVESTSPKETDPQQPPTFGTKRPQTLPGITYKLRWPHQDEALYLTINSWPDGKPFEVFLTSKNVNHSEWTAAVTRLMSAVFRKGGDLDFIVDELTQVMSADGGAFITPPGYTKPKHVPSIVALIGYALEDFFGKKPASPSLAVGRICPACQGENYRFIENCWNCGDCGHGKCG